MLLITSSSVHVSAHQMSWRVFLHVIDQKLQNPESWNLDVVCEFVKAGYVV